MNKHIARLLVLALTLGLLSACGALQSAGESTAPAAQESPSISEAAEAAGEPAQAPEESDMEVSKPSDGASAAEPEVTVHYPLVDETTTLTAFAALPNLYTGLEVNDFAIYQNAEEATGVHIDWQTVDQDASTDQFALIIASGDWPDIAVGGIRYYTSGSEAAVEDEVFVDLAPYLEDYAPDYLEFLNSNEYYKKLVTTASGYIPAVCRVGYVNSGASGIQIRQDWLEELGLEAPSTYDELTAVIKEFQSAYDCDWAIMKGSALYFDISGTMMGGYGLTSDFTVRDGEVCYSPTLDEWKDYMGMLTEWYQDGLYSSDYTTIIGTSFTQYLYNGEVGCWVGGYDFLSDSTASMVNDPNFKAMAVADMTVNEGDTIHTGTFKETMTPTSSWSIFTTSDNLELALSYCNWFYADGAILTDVGEEGVAWEYDDNGNIVYTELIMNNPDGYTVEICKALYGGGFLNPGYGSWNNNSAGFSNEAEAECFDIWNSNRDDENLYRTVMTAEESSTYNALNNDLKTYLDESFNKVIVGELTVDDWDEVVTQMYDAFSLQEMIDICQTAYDRYMEA